ncbi:MAG: helix-turn-helix transcriptional regulator [Clostridia bacterium]
MEDKIILFANNLKEMTLNEKSLLNFSKKIGISQPTLYRYIKGEREIGLINLWKLADYFDISIDELIGRNF